MNGIQEVVTIVLYEALALLSLQLLIIITGDKLIATLLLIQVVSTSLLWSFNASMQRSDPVFALFLAVDLLGLATISYIYRANRSNAFPKKGWLIAGFGMILILTMAVLFVAN